jgi:DNA polymerase (family 10)
MNNKEIAELLKQIAVYKELNGENPFKIRAFESASRNISSLPREATVLAREGKLKEVRGIGKAVEEVILEYIQKGTSSELQELKSSFPESITDLLAIPGMGPKKVKAVYEKLGVSAIGELEYACKENRLITLEGFGEKSQEKILKGIEFKKRYRDRHLISEALSVARDVVEKLEATGLFTEITPAGSLRRGKTSFKDIDVVVVPAEATPQEKVRSALISLSHSDAGFENEEVIGAGPTKVSIRRNGVQIDFRIIGKDSYQTALQHFTGSKEHNTLLRARAKKLGLKMNEYGIFRGEQPIPVQNEEGVYGSVGLPFIPPEIREGEREIEAAEEGQLPVLVKRNDIHGMIHVHSLYSDGSQSIPTLAEECIKRGYSYLCISDHSRSAFYANGLSAERLLEQIQEVKALNEELRPFRVFCGIESDILADGKLDYPDEMLMKLDFVIGSIHSKLTMDLEEANTRLINAINNPCITILGHISGRLLLSRQGYPYDEEKILTALESRGVVLEHNCNPHRLDPDWPFLKKATQRGIQISLGPDAHSIEGFDDMEYGLIMARKGWVQKKGLLNCLTAEEIGDFFAERKKAVRSS